MLAAIARGLHLSLDGATTCRMAGTTRQPRGLSDHITPGIMRILDRLGRTPRR